ncbi:putative START-like domain-containing protein [Lupinus albus]|uniref:Putative START-like domain-containing protein n=1 Tax=Lupinus albus TaxID=3870 RepID=A0A6A4Q1C2_LUPAL|nr:putative START-like domain-containing protein [Lupinus albus]
MSFKLDSVKFFNAKYLIQMYQELQVLSPHVSTREFHFLRYSQEIEKGTWAIVDVSYDNPQDKQCMPQFRSHRFPSGCLIQNMPNGQSKVTWIEHVEVEDKTPIHKYFRNCIYSGMAFGAERWLAILQRMCERMSSLTVTTNSTRGLGGVITSPEGKTSMLKLCQRMVTNFCASVGTSNGQNWTTTFGSNEIRFRVTSHKSKDPKQTNGVVLSAATTIWLPIPLHIVFNFFKDEKRRPQWDVLSNGNPMQEVANIVNGSHPGNSISILQDFNTTKNGMLILQESCIDSSGALVVYCPVDLPSINKAMSGEDPSFIPLIPSGFSISPDGHRRRGGGDRASTSSSLTRSIGGSGGSLITILFQILVSNIPSAEINMDLVAHVTKLINTAIQQIKVSLNYPSSLS